MYVLGVLRKSIYEDDIQPKIQVPPSTGFESPHGFERCMSWDLKGIVCIMIHAQYIVSYNRLW